MPAAPDAIPAPQPVRKSHRLRNIVLVIVVAFAIVIVAVAAAGFIYGLSGGSSPSRQTWQQYGMSMQYPTGVKAQYSGVLNQQADSASGEVEWLWNGANTGLDVAWVSTTSYNLTAGLQAIHNLLLSKASNVLITDQGTTTFAGHSWQYQTYSFVENGQTGYATYGAAYFNSSGRAYVIGFVDTSNTTLASLQSYGNTFTG